MSKVISCRIGTFGQSNMQGMDNLSGFTTPSFSTFVNNGTDDFKFSESYASLIPNFTKKIQEKYVNLGISFTRTEVGSTGIVDVWSDNASATYISAKNKLLGSTIDYLLCFGGESDIASGKSAIDFYNAWLLTISNFRSDLGIPDLKVAIIKPYAGAYSVAQNDAIRDTFDLLESEGHVTIIGDAFDYQYDLIDAIHIGRTGLDALGTFSGNLFTPLLNYIEYRTPSIIGQYINKSTLININPEAERVDRTTDENTGNCAILNAISNSSPTSMYLDGFPVGYGFKAKTANERAHYAFNTTSTYPIQSNFPLSSTASIGELSIIAEVLFTATTDQIDILDQRDGLNNNIIFAATGGTLYCFFNYGGTNVYSTMAVSGNIPIGEPVFVGLSFNGAGATNADKIKYNINGVDKSASMSFVGTFLSTTPNTVDANFKIYGTTGTKLYGLDIQNKKMSTQNFLDYIELGSAKNGLIGVANSDGTQELYDNRIGLFNPYNNIMAALLSTDPATVDRNTGFINCFNGESASATRTGILTNFASGEGFIAKSGSIPAHILGNGVNGEVILPNSSFVIDSTSKHTFILRWKKAASGLEIIAGSYNLADNVNFWIGTNSSNNIQLSIGDGTNLIEYKGSSVLSVGVWYDIAICLDSLTAKIYLNAIEETVTKTGSAWISSTMLDYSLFNRRYVSNFSGGELQNFIQYSDAKSLSFIKDQYFSSQNEWQNDLTGTLQAVPDGTLDLSSEYTYLDAQHVWLENHNFSAIPHDWGCGQIGEYSRSAGVGYTDESLARFDISQFSGENVNSVRLITYNSQQGTQVSPATSKVYEQNKTSLVGVTDAPVFDDFAQTAWDTVLSSLAVQNIGSYEYLDGSNLIKGLVQDWIDGTKDNEDGIIIDANFQAVGYYLYVCSVKLGVKISTGGTVIVPFHILNYLNQSF